MPRFTHWIRLLWNCLLGVKKTADGRPEIELIFHLPVSGSSFYPLKFASFPSIQRVFEPFQWSRTFFSSISGIKMSWRAISSDYLLHMEIWAIGCMHYLTKMGQLWSRLPWAKKIIYHGLGLGNFGNTGTSRSQFNYHSLRMEKGFSNKNVIVFFLEIKIQNGAHLKKGLFLAYFSHFLVTREKLQKFLQHVSCSHTYVYFAHPIDYFCLTNCEKNTNLSGMVSLWCDSWCWFLFTSFWNNQ